MAWTIEFYNDGSEAAPWRHACLRDGVKITGASGFVSKADAKTDAEYSIRFYTNQPGADADLESREVFQP